MEETHRFDILVLSSAIQSQVLLLLLPKVYAELSAQQSPQVTGQLARTSAFWQKKERLLSLFLIWLQVFPYFENASSSMQLESLSVGLLEMEGLCDGGCDTDGVLDGDGETEGPSGQFSQVLGHLSFTYRLLLTCGQRTSFFLCTTALVPEDSQAQVLPLFFQALNVKVELSSQVWAMVHEKTPK